MYLRSVRYDASEQYTKTMKPFQKTSSENVRAYKPEKRTYYQVNDKACTPTRLVFGLGGSLTVVVQLGNMLAYIGVRVV